MLDLRPPKVGDTIYVPTAVYLSHGVDDFIGGRAVVTAVEEGMSAGKMEPFVRVAEQPSTRYNWTILAEGQEELRQEFGDAVAHADPDERPEFNRWD